MWLNCFLLILLFEGSNLDALKTAASCGSMEPVAINTSELSLGRRRSSSDWYKNQLTFKLRIRDPLITKQSKQYVMSLSIFTCIFMTNDGVKSECMTNHTLNTFKLLNFITRLNAAYIF